MTDIHTQTLQEVATHLDVTPATLRRWTDEFARFLSPLANPQDEQSYRRYTEADVDILQRIKLLISDNLTDEEVKQNLDQPDPTSGSTGLVSMDDISRAAMGYLSETMAELHQGQLSILNSQAANRELMGVLIQDNFNLKEENNRMRQRMLELERQMSQLRRDEMSRRESLRQELEAKLMEVREMATRSPITVLQNRAGCLGSLLGMNGQIRQIPQSGQQQYSAPPPPPPPSYPRPPAPPE